MLLQWSVQHCLVSVLVWSWGPVGTCCVSERACHICTPWNKTRQHLWVRIFMTTDPSHYKLLGELSLCITHIRTGEQVELEPQTKGMKHKPGRAPVPVSIAFLFTKPHAATPTQGQAQPIRGVKLWGVIFPYQGGWKYTCTESWKVGGYIWRNFCSGLFTVWSIYPWSILSFAS